ncbi:MAG: hypothetical protein ACRDJ5_01970 [Actinomycetota bacterium]
MATATTGRARLARAAAGVALLAASLMLPFAPAQARLSASVGEPNADSGLPAFYQDRTGLRLKICEDAVRCGDLDPLAPVYWAAEAEVPTRGAGTAGISMSLDGGYANETSVVAEEAITLATIEIRAENLRPDRRYTFVHPYGTVRAFSDNRGDVRAIQEAGCHPEVEPGQPVPQCNFSRAIDAKFGPFLQWDPRVRKAPAGFLGNAETARRVIGSPTGRNYFEVSGPGLGTVARRSVRTNRFLVMGEKVGRDRVAPRVRVRSRALDVSAKRAGTIVSRISESARVEVKVKRNGRLKRSWSKRVWGPDRLELSWNGRNRAGDRVRPGTYKLVVKATDLAGNPTVKRTAGITVKR